MPNETAGPLLTLPVHDDMLKARAAGQTMLACSLDLGRSTVSVGLEASGWTWGSRRFPYPEVVKDRTIYYWDGAGFAPVSRYTTSLIKLVPTPWGPPTFEIDGIKMLPSLQVSPFADAERKVALIQPRGKRVLDTCGGLGYFAACCLAGGAQAIRSFEINADVIWLRGLNPWSPEYPDATLDRSALSLTHGSSLEAIASMADASFDAVLHDPPRFGIAGDLYSQAFYDQLARVLRPGGRLFHYTGTPNKLTSGRDVQREVSKRLQAAGFTTQIDGDGIVGVRAKAGWRR